MKFDLLMRQKLKMKEKKIVIVGAGIVGGGASLTEQPAPVLPAFEPVNVHIESSIPEDDNRQSTADNKVGVVEVESKGKGRGKGETKGKVEGKSGVVLKEGDKQKEK